MNKTLKLIFIMKKNICSKCIYIHSMHKKSIRHSSSSPEWRESSLPGLVGKVKEGRIIQKKWILIRGKESRIKSTCGCGNWDWRIVREAVEDPVRQGGWFDASRWWWWSYNTWVLCGAYGKGLGKWEEVRRCVWLSITSTSFYI